MALASSSELRDVAGITAAQQAEIRAFLQGAVYCWVKNRKGEEFAARDLFGGENGNWAGTPLQALYEKHLAEGKAATLAEEAAARDLGWLIKSVLHQDKRTFNASNDGWVNKYQWVRDEA
jgi:hypothetical protein